MRAFKQNIKYIAFYNIDSYNKEENRNTFLAINNKINYICNVLNRSGYDVNIISPCWSNNISGFYKGRTYTISDGIQLRNFATFGSNTWITKKIKHVFSMLQLILYLIKNTKKNEQIIVYHSLALCLPIIIANFFKKFEIILEVEEIYTDVWKEKGNINREIQYIEKADKYIFVSDILKNKFADKPSVVLYGSYKVIEKSINTKKRIDIVDIVYAGSIDETKGGAKNAVLSSQYLPNNYRMHILGFGNSKTIEKLMNDIKTVNSKKGYECCKYHGVKTGNEYKEFLQRCHIGINPQLEGEYMETAFPSKVLSYLSHGLIVVSTRIKSIQYSKINKHVFFTENDNPKSIAETIRSINLYQEFNTVELIERLDKDFVEDFNNLLN